MTLLERSAVERRLSPGIPSGGRSACAPLRRSRPANTAPPRAADRHRMATATQSQRLVRGRLAPTGNGMTSPISCLSAGAPQALLWPFVDFQRSPATGVPSPQGVDRRTSTGRATPWTAASYWPTTPGRLSRTLQRCSPPERQVRAARSGLSMPRLHPASPAHGREGAVSPVQPWRWDAPMIVPPATRRRRSGCGLRVHRRCAGPGFRWRRRSWPRSACRSWSAAAW